MAALPAPITAHAPGLSRQNLVIRDLVPADAHLLDAVLAGLSERSRYQRFQTPKPRLSARERTYLAGADGHDHIALVALDPTGAPLAVARAVRLQGRPDTAEIAAEVVDPWQRRGLGSDLIGRIARRAAAAGVQRFTATVLSETTLTRSLVRRGWSVVSHDGPSTDLEVDVWALLTAAR